MFTMSIINNDVVAVRLEPETVRIGHSEAAARERVPVEAAQRRRRRRRRRDAADNVGMRVTDHDASRRQGDDVDDDGGDCVTLPK